MKMIIYDEEVINQIKDKLINKKETIAVAESVTSGHLQAAFSLAMDASQFYQGGITTYNLGQKTRHLNIEPINATKVNCVDKNISHGMAINASRLFLSHYAVGITGYASMVPECEKEGLHAFIAFCHKQEVVFSKRIVSKKGNPLDVQIDYTNQVASLFLEYLNTEQ